MEVIIMMLDYKSKGEAIPVVVSQQFAEAEPEIRTPNKIAKTLEYISSKTGVGFDDEDIEALKIAVELFRNIEDVLDWTEFKKLVIGKVEGIS